MDPNETVARIRALIDEVRQDTNPDAAAELAEAFEDLDRWLRNGGFLPAEWATLPTGAAR